MYITGAQGKVQSELGFSIIFQVVIAVKWLFMKGIYINECREICKNQGSPSFVVSTVVLQRLYLSNRLIYVTFF